VLAILGQRRESEHAGKTAAGSQHPRLCEERMDNRMTWPTLTQTDDTTELELHPIPPAPLPGPSRRRLEALRAHRGAKAG
jgi:hypothetical protein